MDNNEDRLRVALATVLVEDAITIEEAVAQAGEKMQLRNGRLYVAADVLSKAFGQDVLALGKHFTQHGPVATELVYVDSNLAKLALDRAIDRLEEVSGDLAAPARAAVRLGRALSQVVG